MNGLTLPSRFVARHPPPCVFPTDSTISLPAGEVVVLSDGRILDRPKRLIGIFVSADLCLVAQPQIARIDDIILIEQLVGFAHARGVSVMRSRQRCLSK